MRDACVIPSPRVSLVLSEIVIPMSVIVRKLSRRLAIEMRVSVVQLSLEGRDRVVCILPLIFVQNMDCTTHFVDLRLL